MAVMTSRIPGTAALDRNGVRLASRLMRLRHRAWSNRADALDLQDARRAAGWERAFNCYGVALLRLGIDSY